MRPAPSLTNRIFLACLLLATLSLGFALYFVNARVTAEAEAELQRGLAEAGRLVDQHRATLTDTFTRLARLVADLPKLKAAVATGDAPTVQPLAEDYRVQMNADWLVITGPGGGTLATSGAAAADRQNGSIGGGSRDELSTFVRHPRGLLQIVSVPIFIGVDRTELLGRLAVGFFLDDALAAQFKALTGSEIAFAADGRVVASSLPSADRPSLEAALAGRDESLVLDAAEFVLLASPMLTGSTPRAAAGPPVTLVLRSRTARLQFLATVRAGIAVTLVGTLLLATVLSYAVARTMTRPLAAVTRAMREVAATGDLTRKVVLRSRAWDDEDARLLASAFNTLTESIARFQQEAAQRERLSSLGRLSTVVAHEIRNPLMIIRASLRTLRREGLTATELHEAVADIDEESQRLNRIVTEVLDFARPIRFDLAPASLNEICRASVGAAWAGDPVEGVRLELDESLPPLVTDGERLRTALVNILTNARHAVQAHPAETPAATPPVPGVIVRTERRGGHAAVIVRDLGVGISSDDMAHIFDPYFTTRRAGTGLGLPIARNIVDGLGGTIDVASEAGRGTEIRILLPLASGAAA